MGGLKVNIGHLRNLQIQKVAYFLASIVLVNLLRHFRQRLWFHHLKTWWQVQKIKLLFSRCNHILGSDFRLFGIVGIRDSKNFASNHFVLYAWLLRWPTRCYVEYLIIRLAFPLNLPPMGLLKRVGTKFQYPKALRAPPSPCTRALRPQLMSEFFLCLIDVHASLHHQTDHNRNMACTMTRDVWRSLTKNSCRWADVDSEDIGACLYIP